MTLLVTVFAAVFVTVLWYRGEKDDMQLSFLSLIFWGASLMWLVDALFEYAELGAEYFTPSMEDMANDTFLGFSAVALGLVIWLVRLLITDPRGSVRKALLRKKNPQPSKTKQAA